MNCLIIDDEPMAIKVIESHVSNFDDLKVVGTCQSALEAFPILQKEKIDILFLDIEMPKINGLSFLKSLKSLYSLQNRNIMNYNLNIFDIIFKSFFKCYIFIRKNDINLVLYILTFSKYNNLNYLS